VLCVKHGIKRGGTLPGIFPENVKATLQDRVSQTGVYGALRLVTSAQERED